MSVQFQILKKPRTSIIVQTIPVNGQSLKLIAGATSIDRGSPKTNDLTIPSGRQYPISIVRMNPINRQYPRSIVSTVSIVRQSMTSLARTIEINRQPRDSAVGAVAY